MLKTGSVVNRSLKWLKMLLRFGSMRFELPVPERCPTRSLKRLLMIENSIAIRSSVISVVMMWTL